MSAGSRISASSSVHEAFLDGTAEASDNPLDRKALLSLEMRLEEHKAAQHQRDQDRKGVSKIDAKVSSEGTFV